MKRRPFRRMAVHESTPMSEILRPPRPAFGPALLPLVALALALGGCGMASVEEMLPDQTIAYKKSREASVNLELPPDLTSGTFDDALDVPSVDGAGATYSDYASGRARRQQVASAGDVLPQTESVELRRNGNDRWLEVQGTPQQVWPRVIAFWREQGILLVEEDPAVGTMKTDWLENRAEIPQDFLTRQLRKVVDGLYATSTRDQYSVRIDNGSKPGVTEIHLAQKGMAEKLVSATAAGDSTRTVWEPSGTDPDKEAAMLRRLMLFLGAPKRDVDSALAGGPARAAPGSTPASSARLTDQGGAQVLVIPEELRRGWRMTGFALDRAGFSVEDRNMSQGLFYVRYQDTDLAKGQQKRSLGDRLAFWRKNDIDRVKQYRIRVQGSETETRVSVEDAAGKPDSSPAAGKILELLKEQMT